MDTPSGSPSKQASANRVRLIVADCYPLIVHGLVKIVDEEDDAEIVAAATSFRELRDKLLEVPAELALIDWALLRGNPTDAQDLMKAIPSETRVIVLIASESMHERRFALQLGARGIVGKHSSGKEVLKAIWKVHRGGLSIDQAAAEALLDQTLSPDAAEYRKGERLTNRERQVSLLVCRGLTNKQISAELGISETTVWHHLTSVFSKLEVSGRVGLVNYVHKHLLLSGEPSAPRNRRRTKQWSVIETPTVPLTRKSRSEPGMLNVLARAK
jgi:two-component system, NarL family, nitrate/nitrite response regulator NarL